MGMHTAAKKFVKLYFLSKKKEKKEEAQKGGGKAGTNIHKNLVKK